MKFTLTFIFHLQIDGASSHSNERYFSLLFTIKWRSVPSSYGRHCLVLFCRKEFKNKACKGSVLFGRWPWPFVPLLLGVVLEDLLVQIRPNLNSPWLQSTIESMLKKIYLTLEMLISSPLAGGLSDLGRLWSSQATMSSSVSREVPKRAFTVSMFGGIGTVWGTSFVSFTRPRTLTQRDERQQTIIVLL